MLEKRANKNVRKNDTVMVIRGKNKGKSGRVLRVIPEKASLVVEKVNFIKKHQRPTSQMKQGGIVEREGALRLDNVMVVCPKCAKPVRIKIERDKSGQKKRKCAKCNGLVDLKK